MATASTESSRPSFASFWRLGKSKLKGGKSNEVEDVSPPVDTTTTTTANDESQAAKTRQQNQARRAQVRSAQIRHRQRKANHQRQLELDMTEYQSLIAQIEGETTALRRQNAEMRARLGAAGIMLDDSGNEVAVLTDDDDDDDQSMPSAPGSPPAVPAYLGTGDVYDQDVDQPPELFSSIDVDRLTVTLAMDDTMGSPALQISGSASTSAASSTEAASLLSPDAHNAGTSSAATSPPTEPAPAKYLSPVQEEAAVNFILALEHVCWSHFMMGDFAHHHDMPETPPGTSDYRVCCAGGPELPDDFPDPDEHGHALMASTYCMGAAPAPVFDYTMEALFRDLEARRRRDSSSTSGSTTSDSDRGGGSGASSSSGASMAHSDASASPPPPPGPPKARPTPAMEWKSPSSSMTLANLYGLASSLNPGDEDLTPVQAWFELAERYDPATLIDSGVLESLKRELRGVVHCLYYGAVMERAAFESVLDRVMKGFPVCFL